MRKIFGLLCIIILSCTSNTKEDETSIKQTFDGYKAAILADQGKKAIEYLDKHTIDYYSRLLELTKKADSLEVDKLNVLDKLMVLIMRLKLNKDELKSMDSKGLLEYAINNGMIGKESVEQSSLGNIKVKNDKGEAEYVVGGKKTPLFIEFYKEAGGWKLDITSIMDESIEALNAKIREEGMTENDFVKGVIESRYEEPVTSELWTPRQ